jgi:D-alanyl-D-alanine carboxypeptidase
VLRIVLSLLVLLAVSPPAFAADRKPVTCAAAKPYQGPPLHAALPDEAFAGVAGPLDAALAPALVARLDAAADWILANTSAPGITAAVGIPGQGLWSTSRGLLVAEPPAALPEWPLFHWASAGKAFTAVVVSQLVEAGRLRYDDPLAKWFPKFPNAGAITVDHLLTHTNGTFSFQGDLELRRKTGYKAPAELLRVAERHGSDFCPGEHWSYSNTGYVLLGRIVEEIEGKPFHEVVRERILGPLRLQDTVALAPRQKPPGLAIGHRGRKPEWL